MEQQILEFILRREFYSRVKHVLSEDMFEGLAKTIFRTIVECHDLAETDLLSGEVHTKLLTANPALTKSTREDISSIFEHMKSPNGSGNLDLQQKIVEDFWARDQARIIGEKAIDIYTGESLDFTSIKEVLEKVAGYTVRNSETYLTVDADFDELLDRKTRKADFPFDLGIISEHVPGLFRGNLGIIFARPESGKTTFCSHLCAAYIRQKKRVVYWQNEEPSEDVKFRIIQSYHRLTKEDMAVSRDTLREIYKNEIEPYLIMQDCVGTSLDEIEHYCKLEKPDVVFADQLDKFGVAGEFSRADEKLRKIYIYAREIAKRNNLLFWAVSQANYEANNRMEIDYSMLENSRTGKAAEADFILGIGKTGEITADNYMRFLCISKNKINGWHGTINSNIDINRGFYY